MINFNLFAVDFGAIFDLLIIPKLRYRGMMKDWSGADIHESEGVNRRERNRS